jgi:hypothetical protein
MAGELEKYLSPSSRTEAYMKAILMEGFNALKEQAAGADNVLITKETLLHIKKHCLARVYWLLEKHPNDRPLITNANRYAAQLLESTIRKFVNESGAQQLVLPLS